LQGRCCGTHRSISTPSIKARILPGDYSYGRSALICDKPHPVLSRSFQDILILLRNFPQGISSIHYFILKQKNHSRGPKLENILSNTPHLETLE